MLARTEGGFELLAAYEEALYELGGRPHWGQVNSLPGGARRLAALYPELPQWLEVRRGINRTLDRGEASWLLKLFHRDRVSAVFAGYVPMYARQTYLGVPYVTTGGGGQRLWGTPRQGGFYHFVRVDVDGNRLLITPVALN